MSTKTLYIAQNVRLYLSQPLNPRREMLDAMMDPYPELKADLTKKLEHRVSSYDDLSDEYYDRQVELLDSIAPKQLQSLITWLLKSLMVGVKMVQNQCELLSQTPPIHAYSPETRTMLK